MCSRMACKGLTRLAPTRLAIGSHHAPSPSITRPRPSTNPPNSHRVDHVAAITAGLRVHIGSTPEPTPSCFHLIATVPSVMVMPHLGNTTASVMRSFQLADLVHRRLDILAAWQDGAFERWRHRDGRIECTNALDRRRQLREQLLGNRCA